ncbi:hypothetical protein [Gluconacetobacter azotocaptans]|uniref:hypothetical protein n=1 Tax=Gluconacetobacter azotocaptans TaxID=142834 RepID=UPI00195DDB20|nr:hypothetical protein [Gluconacetobacter azotocaptans]
MRDIAQSTGGSFFRAMDRGSLAQVHSQINATETHEIDIVSERPRSDLFWWPIGAVLMLTIGIQASWLRPRRSRRPIWGRT